MAVSVDGLPAVLCEGLRVCVVPPALKGNRWHVVDGVSSTAAGQLVSLSGVGDLGSARSLAGKWLLAREEDLPRDLLAHDARALVGREVTDARLGSLGRVADVMYGPANDVWVVEGARGETLVPVVESVVGEVSPGDGPLQVSLPVGLAPGDDGGVVA